MLGNFMGMDFTPLVGDVFSHYQLPSINLPINQSVSQSINKSIFESLNQPLVPSTMIYKDRWSYHCTIGNPSPMECRCSLLVKFLWDWHHYTPRFNEVERGVYWYHLVRLSVCLSVCGQDRVRSVSSTILIGSISYLHILSSNLRCVACNVHFKIWNLANFFNL